MIKCRLGYLVLVEIIILFELLLRYSQRINRCAALCGRWELSQLQLQCNNLLIEMELFYAVVGVSTLFVWFG